VAIAGASLGVVTLTTDAMLGGFLQRGSMLNLRPLDGGRWYGFANITFAAYAVAVLVVVGYLVGRLPQAGHARAAGLGVASWGWGRCWSTAGLRWGRTSGASPR
jgi:hypothetical protein